jgi:hypothetical protein
MAGGQKSARLTPAAQTGTLPPLRGCGRATRGACRGRCRPKSGLGAEAQADFLPLIIIIIIIICTRRGLQR